MKNISEVDPNFKVDEQNDREGLVFKNVREEPFRIYGVFHDGVQYRRLPKDVATATSKGVDKFAACAAGGRVRFVTDSPYVVIKAEMKDNYGSPKMPLTCTVGFDLYLYENGRYNHIKTFVPPSDLRDSYDGACDFTEGEGERILTLNFPLYGQVRELYIGIKEGSTLSAAPDYKYEKPIVYYGSSITQGGCASRPGNCYQGFIERRFDTNYINLGFSGNAKGEVAMAEYIASLDMSAFVMDYDHNAPSVEHYEATHEPFYKIVRAKNPDLPIIILTRPKVKFLLSESELQRIEIAKKTYRRAKRRGEPVYFIPSYELTKLCDDGGSVDRAHPNDLGFRSMADAISKVISKILCD